MDGTSLLFIFPVLMVVAGVGDWLTLRISNALTGGLALAFIPAALIAGLPMAGIGWHLATGALVLALGFGLFAAGWFGGGDAKLMAAASLWFGWPGTAEFLVYSGLAGGALALVIAIWSAIKLDAEIKGRARLNAWLKAKPDVPYGVALAAGTLFALPGTWLVTGAA